MRGTPPFTEVREAALARTEPFTVRDLADELEVGNPAGLYAQLNEVVDTGLLIEDDSVRPKTYLPRSAMPQQKV